MVVITKMPYDDPAASADSPSLSSPSSDSNPLSDDDLQAAVLAHYESLTDTLTEKKGIAAIMCDDRPSCIGSTELPFADDTSESFTPNISEPPTPTTSPDTDPTFTPPGSPFMRFDSCDESPSVDLKTPLKFDTLEGLWRPTEEPETWLSKPLVITPEDCSIDYLQVPPAHRALYRKRSKVMFDNDVEAPDEGTLVVPPSLAEEENLSDDQLDFVGEEDEGSGHEEGSPLIVAGITGANGNIPKPGRQEESVKMANCTIKVPMSQRKPSLSNINLPCYKRRPSGQALDINFDYTFTVMYGRYTKDLGRYALEEAKKLKKEDKKVIDETGAGAGLRPYRGKIATKCMNVFGTIWKNTFARVGEDWVFLAMLGVFMAIVSFVMDYGISICNHARIWLYKDLASHTALQYLAWVSLPVFLILFSAGFVHILAPQAVGSGIPEMKTILRGVVLKEYLTFKTLIAKVIGLTATLGSGLPLGKEGPFVHIASIVATLLSKAVTSFKGIYENESRNSEMLAAACAVGVACSFAAPIGGVLFSIEVTSVYFAVRNYWRGFFAAVCGAMTFRLMAVWFNDEETLTALFKTGFKVESPFDPQELFVFATIGVLCGFLGSFFVWVHRQYVIFMRRNKKMKAFLQKSLFAYPVLFTIFFSSVTYPSALGQFICSHQSTHHQVVELFSNITWTKENLTVHEFEIVENWRTPWTGIFINLIIYMIFTFCGAVVASTLPVPSGIFIPVFKIGAALGRLIGEGMATGFPNGLRYGGTKHMIIPGGYSIVGAAAMAGAVTHTISTSVIVFELTGQITHILPVMIAVLIANGIAQLLQPSVYDSIIQIKKLPYLPDILTATSGAYNIYVEDFMVRDVKYIWYGITYRELKNTLREHKKIRSLPLVDSPDSMILLGSIQRSELISMLEEHLGKDRRLKVINRWKFAASKALEAEQVQKEKDERDRDESRKSQLNQLQDDVHNKRRPPAVGLAALTSVGGAMAFAVAPGLPQYDSNEHTGTSPIASTPANNSLANSDPRNTNTNSNVSATNTTPGSPPDFNKERRPSRFEVTKVDTPRVEHTTKKEETSANNDSSIALQIDPIEIPKSDTDLARPKRSSFPRKSILKKTNSFILPLPTGSPFVSPQHTPYATVHASDSRLRQAFEKVLKRTNLKKGDSANTIHSFSGSTKNIQTPMDRMVEMTLEEQRRWEEEELSKEVDFTKCHIDPAPFQLVERTSLLKVHSLFSMLGLNHAYVTAIGRIIGVVALKELRKAVDSTNCGELPRQKLNIKRGAGGEIGLESKERVGSQGGIGGGYREKFLRPTIRRKLRKAIEETNHGDFQTKAARRDSQDQKKSKD